MRSRALTSRSPRSSRFVAAFLALTLTGGALPAFAQMDADTKEAKVLFEEGVKLYKAGNYEDARVKFKAAYGLKKRPSIVINLARAELQTKRPVDAAAHFREAINLPDIKPEDRDDAKSGLADARKQLGVITVDAPSGSTVMIDGANVTVPDDGIEVAPGMHTVSIKTSAGKETNEKVSLDAGKSTTVHAKSESTTPPVVVPPPTTTTPETTTPATTTTPETTTPETTTTTTSTTTNTTTDTGPPNQPGFFASIHPVTYVAAGATVIFGALWIGFYSAMNTHQNNADKLSSALDGKGGNSCRTKTCELWRAQGRDEVDMFNSDKTLTILFGIGTGVAAAATVITYITMRKKSPTVSFVAAPTYGGATFSLSGSF